MTERGITDLLLRLVLMLPAEARGGVAWLTTHYDTVGRPILTLGFLAVLLVEIAVIAFAVRLVRE